MNLEKIKQIQDDLLEKVEPTTQKWADKDFIYCPTCGRIWERNERKDE